MKLNFVAQAPGSPTRALRGGVEVLLPVRTYSHHMRRLSAAISRLVAQIHLAFWK